MNLLILGSDSFIARHFINRFQNQFSMSFVSRIATNLIGEIVVEDMFKIPEEIFRNIEVVINFAGIVHKPSIIDEEIYNSINYKLTLINAKKARNSNVKLFIQMSTIAVYGNIDYISINTPCKPLTPYGRSKQKGDDALLKIQNKIFKVAIVRPPMVYGAGNSPGNMMRLIILVDRVHILPFKKAVITRDFININNLIQYLAVISQKRLHGIFLICDNEPVSTGFVVNVISKYIDRKIYLISIPKFGLNILKIVRPMEYFKLFGIQRIKTNFPHENLITRFTVEGGIKEMADWYLRNKKG